MNSNDALKELVDEVFEIYRGLYKNSDTAAILTAAAVAELLSNLENTTITVVGHPPDVRTN